MSGRLGSALAGVAAVLVLALAIAMAMRGEQVSTTAPAAAADDDSADVPEVEVLTESVAADAADVDTTEDASPAAASPGRAAADAPAEEVRPAVQLAASSFTGDAEVDLPDTDPNVVIVVDGAGLPDVPVDPPLNTVPRLPDGSTPISGWDLKDLRYRYDPSTDALTVGLNSFGVVGDPEGNGDPSSFDQAWIDAGFLGVDAADLGPQEALFLVLDLDQDGTGDVIVGTHSANDISDFAVHLIPAGLGALAPSGGQSPFLWADKVTDVENITNPSASSPDLVFTIPEFSTLLAGDDDLDFGVIAIANVPNDIVGEESVPGPNTFGTVDLSARIGDLVWLDENADGVQGVRESGVAGATVILRSAAGAELDRTTTDAHGRWSFTVDPGTYTVEFRPGAGRLLTVPNAGSADRDSNPSRSTGITPEFTVLPGTDDLTIDAGVVDFAPAISIEKATNDVDSDEAPGELLLVGDEVVFTYEITNIGNVRLDSIVVTDDRIDGPIECPQQALDPDIAMTCSATGVVVAGQYVNVGSVVGTPVDRTGFVLGDDVTDDDPSHHVGVEVGIDIEKATNGVDADDPADGPVLVVGEDATFTYVVTNTGDVDLVDVVVTDDQLDGVVCEIDRLTPGQSETCEATATVVAGQYANIGTAIGQPVRPDGEPLGPVVEDSDPSHHLGELPGPVCETTIGGPRLYRGAQTVHETGYAAAPGSTIRIVTLEPGDSPDQPNEQVYVRVGDELFGPTPVGLGELEFTVATGGDVTILHISEIQTDLHRANSVEYLWCGDDITRSYKHVCPAAVSGPRMWKGNVVLWDSGLVAEPGSSVTVVTSEPGGSPNQPNEQVYVFVGDELVGVTSPEHGENVFDAGAGGRIVVRHWSEFNDEGGANSVEFTLCGTRLYEG